MAADARARIVTVRLTPEEIYMRDKIAELNGIDGSGVMRMGLRKLAKQEGVPPYVPPAAASTGSKGGGKKRGGEA